MRLADLAYGPLPEHVGDPAVLAAELEAERLAPLVLSRLQDQNRLPSLREALQAPSLESAGRDLAQSAILNDVGDAASGLRLLVIKGAAAGPLLYGSGALRPRWDLDVWVDGWSSAELLAGRLEDRGWTPAHQLPGHLCRHAIALKRRSGEDIDIHARACKRLRVANALDFETVWLDRQPLGRLSSPSNRHAWLLAATHLTAHHAGQEPPAILLEDLRRLSARLDGDDWDWLWSQGVEFGLLSAMAAAVTGVERWAPGVCDPSFASAVLAAPPDESEAFEREVEAVFDDLSLLEAGPAVEYLRELVLPPAPYLYEHYGVARDRPVALLRAHRLVRAGLARVARSLGK